jgi:hypothetical protein
LGVDPNRWILTVFILNSCNPQEVVLYWFIARDAFFPIFSAKLNLPWQGFEGYIFVTPKQRKVLWTFALLVCEFGVTLRDSIPIWDCKKLLVCLNLSCIQRKG